MAITPEQIKQNVYKELTENNDQTNPNNYQEITNPNGGVTFRDRTTNKFISRAKAEELGLIKPTSEKTPTSSQEPLQEQRKKLPSLPANKLLDDDSVIVSDNADTQYTMKISDFFSANKDNIQQAISTSDTSTITNPDATIINTPNAPSPAAAVPAAAAAVPPPPAGFKSKLDKSVEDKIFETNYPILSKIIKLLTENNTKSDADKTERSNDAERQNNKDATLSSNLELMVKEQTVTVKLLKELLEAVKDMNGGGGGLFDNLINLAISAALVGARALIASAAAAASAAIASAASAAVAGLSAIGAGSALAGAATAAAPVLIAGAAVLGGAYLAEKYNASPSVAKGRLEDSKKDLIKQEEETEGYKKAIADIEALPAGDPDKELLPAYYENLEKSQASLDKLRSQRASQKEIATGQLRKPVATANPDATPVAPPVATPDRPPSVDVDGHGNVVSMDTIKINPLLTANSKGNSGVPETGPAIVGEEGSETVIHNGVARKTASSAHVEILQKGDIVIPAGVPSEAIPRYADGSPNWGSRYANSADTDNLLEDREEGDAVREQEAVKPPDAIPLRPAPALDPRAAASTAETTAMSENSDRPGNTPDATPVPAAVISESDQMEATTPNRSTSQSTLIPPPPTTGSALLGASNSNEISARTPTPPPPPQETPPTNDNTANPASDTNYNVDPNDPGPVEPADAVTRYRDLFDMAA
jgi:hypothetical protein